MKKLLLALGLLAATTLGALAQSQTLPNRSFPWSAGPGTTGWRSLGPCAVGETIGWPSGAAGSPTCVSAIGITILGTPPITVGLVGATYTIGLTTPLDPSFGGTGLAALGAGVQTWLGTPSSANLAAAVTGETGSGALVFGTSPTLVTPNLGTPSAAVLTNATGLPIATGVSGLGAGVAAWAAVPSSANLATAVTDETGTGSLVFSNSPTLVTPALGTPSALVLTNATGLPVGSLTGLGAGVGTWLATPSSANLATAVTDETGTGALVFATSPTLVTPALGTPSALVLTNATGCPVASCITGLGAGVATFLATPSSANLASAVTGETGSGALVFGSSPTIDSLTVTSAFTAVGLVNNTALANMGPYTFKGRDAGTTGAPGDVAISSLTLKASPAATDLLLLSDQAAGGQFKSVQVSAISSAGSVSDVNGQTGSLTAVAGLQNSGTTFSWNGVYRGNGFANCGLTASVGANLLTVTLTDAAGSTPTSASPCIITYRSTTASTGTMTAVYETAGKSISTNAIGATLGSSNSKAFRFWVVAFNNSGTNVITLYNASTSGSTGASAARCTGIDEGIPSAVDTTQISGSATSAAVFYSPNGTTVTAGKAIKILGYVEYNSTGLATAGTYASAPTWVQMFGESIKPPCDMVAHYLGTNASAQTNATNAYVNGTTVSGGIGVVVNITPKSAANLILVNGGGTYRNGNQAASNGIVSLFNNNTQIGGEIESGNFGTTNVTGPVGLGPFIHGPNTASATVYSIKFKNTDNATTQTFPYVGVGNGMATITVQEIQG